jgi:hypothetical protein
MQAWIGKVAVVGIMYMTREQVRLLRVAVHDVSLKPYL